MKPFEPVVPVQEVTPDWLTHVLTKAGRLNQARVVDVRYETCGTGQLGDSYRFYLEYDRPDAGPHSLVAKFASLDATSREFGFSSGYYRSEIGFYNQLAPRLDVSLPVAVHAALAENNTDFVLLMEDLAPARQVDQLLGCNADEAARVLTQAAALHAASWHDRDLASASWLQGPVKIFHHVTDHFAGVVQKFPDLCGDLVPEADLREASRLIEYADKWKNLLSQPQSLWHSDLRADNVLFDACGNTRPVVLLDWQGVGFGRGTMDIAHFLGTSMNVADRRAHERDLLAHYQQALAAGGVEGYGAEDCWNDYRINAIYGLQVGFFGLGAVKRTPRGDQMWKVWIERTAAQVRDLESFEALAAA